MGDDFMEQVLLLQTDTVSSEVRKLVSVCVKSMCKCTLMYMVMKIIVH